MTKPALTPAETTPNTVLQALQVVSQQSPHALAVLSSDASSLTYSQLCHQITEIGSALRKIGVRSNDRVAILLPDGLQMTIAFLGVSSYACCVPLDSSSPIQELVGLLDSRAVSVLITDAGNAKKFTESGEQHATIVVELFHSGDSIQLHSNSFQFSTIAIEDVNALANAEQSFDDTAVLLHTSCLLYTSPSPRDRG